MHEVEKMRIENDVKDDTQKEELNNIMRKRLEEVENKKKQAGAKLCQAHVKLGLTKLTLFCQAQPKIQLHFQLG